MAVTSTTALVTTSATSSSTPFPPETGSAGTALSELSSIMNVVNTPDLALPDDYPHLLAELKAQIRSAQWTGPPRGSSTPS